MTKRNNQRSGNTQIVESPLLDMNFDFADAPPATRIKPNNNNESGDNEKKEKPKKPPIRKVNLPRSIKKKPVEVEKPKLSKRMKRVKNNLRIDMVGYEQKHYATRSSLKKRRK